MDIKVRATTADEANLLPAIERSAGERFRALPALAWLADDDGMSPQIHLRYIAKGTSWVADLDEQIVGFLCAESMGDVLHIWEFSVRLEHQGKGIGRKLIETAIGYARSKSFSAVTLTTFRGVSWNESFYHSCGFETLPPQKLDARLEKTLHDEIQHGLPADLRCAMRRILLSIPE